MTTRAQLEERARSLRETAREIDRTLGNESPEAPDWKLLMKDDAAIQRMAQALCDEISSEDGGIAVGSLQSARTIVESLLTAAASEDEWRG